MKKMLLDKIGSTYEMLRKSKEVADNEYDSALISEVITEIIISLGKEYDFTFEQYEKDSPIFSQKALMYEGMLLMKIIKDMAKTVIDTNEMSK